MPDVVRLSVTPEQIAVVALEDRSSGNTFTRPLMQGLLDTFEAIRVHPDAKVVVVHGYDNYFCCGGTKEELLDILDGKVKFADLPFFDLLLRCDLPVIAAMQGHAIGGGLVFGCYADILVLAEESLYGAVFMKYGFTPGMGGTHVIPAKLGELLGTEMLYTGRNYYGQDLKNRGVPARVAPRAQVIDTAMALARELADKPRLALMALKRHLAAKMRRELPAVVKQELAMHELTFAQPEVRARIERLFGR
jgi:polyketide biosynthesis enoyl-CoA hydratase PksI